MRGRGSVVVVAALLASSLMLAPAQLADALADAPNCLEFISRTGTIDAPNGASYGGPISADGRYVLFASEATNLGVPDTNGAARDVFVRDTETSALELVSTSTAGTQVPAASDPMAISADGRFVLFNSWGALVEPDPDPGRDLFVRDRLNGITTRVSTNADSASVGGLPVDAGLSDDGRYVVYVTPQSHAAADVNAVADVYRFDTLTNQRTLVSVADDGSPLSLGGDAVSVSGNGNLVLFHSGSIGNFGPGVRAAAVRDITAGTTRVLSPGQARLSANGRDVALASGANITHFDLSTNTSDAIDTLAWGASYDPTPRIADVSPTGRYILLMSSEFFVLDRTLHEAWPARSEYVPIAYLGEGALISATSSSAQAYVWRSPIPSIDSVSPGLITAGTTVQVHLQGAGLVASTTFDFGPDTVVSDFQLLSFANAQVTVAVGAAATTGVRSITATGNTGCPATTGSFIVIPPVAPTTTTTSTTTTLPTTTTSSTTTSTTTTMPTTTTTSPTTTTAPSGPAPHASSVTPALVRPGQGRSISISGTHFAAGATVSIEGIDVVSTTVVDAQHIVAVLSVPVTADGVHVARVTNQNGLTDTLPPAFVVRGSDGEFHSMQPYRAYDSRLTQAVTGQRTIQLTNLPSTGVRAVAANLTVTGATANSYLTTFAVGTAIPNASSINFRAGETKANMVTLPVNAQGQVAVYNFQGAVDVIVDVVGWYSEPSTTPGSVFIGVQPFRRFDTRVDRGTALGPGEALSIPIVSNGSSVAAVMLNVTVTDPSEASYLTVWPTGRAQPYTSNINYVAGDTVPNVVVVPIGAAGSVSFANFAGSAHVIVDVLGVFEGGALPLLGGRFVPTVPTRALDTRLGIGGSSKALSEHSSLTLDVHPAGVPSDATAVVMNVTVAAPTIGGYLTVWPANGPMPDSSNLNFSAAEVTANLVVVSLDGDGRVSFFNAFGATHVIADVVGYYR